MPFYLRKSVSVGPFRFNLSTSGVGISVGVRGFRVGTGPRGHYVRIGRGGIAYRVTLASAPGRRDPPPQTNRSSDGLTAIDSGPVSHMAPQTAQDLLDRIARAHGRQPLARLAALAVLALCAVGLVAGLPALSLVAVLGGLGLYALARHVDRCRKAVLLYDLAPEAEQAFQRFCAAFDGLAASDLVWRIEAEGATRDWKRNAGASSLVRRRGIRPCYGAPSALVTNVGVPHFPLDTVDLFFFPDRLLVFAGKLAGAVDYADLRMEARTNPFVEDERVPGDAEVIGEQWRFVNKDGGPDRRFNGNKRLPVCAYDGLDLTSTSGLNVRLSLSRRGAGIGFARAAWQYTQELQALRETPAPSFEARREGLVQPVFRVAPAFVGGAMPRRRAGTLAAGIAVLLLAALVLWPRPSASPPESALALSRAADPPPALSAAPVPSVVVEPPAVPRTAAPAPAPTGAPVPGMSLAPAPPPPPRPVPRPLIPEVATGSLPPADPSDLPFLSIADAEPVAGPTYQLAMRVNLRSAPSLTARPLAVIERGMPVAVTASRDGWSQIRVAGLVGWIQARYLVPPAAGVAPFGAAPLFGAR